MRAGTLTIAGAAVAALAIAAVASGSLGDAASIDGAGLDVAGLEGAGPDEAAREASRVHVVEVREFAFSPARVQAAVGDTIVWVNLDGLPHTATASDSTWTSPHLDASARWAWVVTAAGEHEYLCAYHPSMRGVIEGR